MTHGAVRRQSQGYVIGVDRPIIIRGMTTRTSVRGIVVISMVTGVTIVGNGNMGPGEWINRIVIKDRRRPGCFTMTGSTIRRELLRYMVWIQGSIVIRLVATYAGVGRVVIIPVMTGSAIIGNACMRSIQSVIVVVNRESSWRPTSIRGVAHGTITWNGQGYMVGVQTGIIIRGMATGTSIGGVLIIAMVTGYTIIRNGQMRSGKWIDGIMVKSSGRPGAFCMANGTVGRELRYHVIWIAYLVIIA